MSSLHWNPNTAIVPFVLENMDPANDSSVGKRLKSRRLRDLTVDTSETRPKLRDLILTFELPLSDLRIPSAAERLTDAGLEENLTSAHLNKDCNMSESQRASTPDHFELFLAASGKLAEMGSFAPVSESQVRTTEVPRGGTMAAGKRRAEHSPGDRMES
ncbi:unnamed protein product [Cochlearia groenlandica]